MAPKKKIAIRVDGNPNMGLGHIYRGIALAEMLKNDFNIEFITKVDSTTSPIKDVGFNIVFLPENIGILNEPEWLEKNFSKDTIVILDGYQFKEQYQRKVKEKGFKLAYIDDLVEYHMVADLVINHAPGINQSDYNAEWYTKFALGSKYAILRPVFLEAAKQERKINEIDTVFICFGGADINDLTLKVTKALIPIKQIKHINVVIGAAYKHSQVFELEKQYPTINIYRNLSENELYNLMLKCNLSIVPASTILYEVCAVQMPSLSGYSIENQKIIYKGTKGLNIYYPLGDLNILYQNQISEKVISLISDKSILQHIKNQKRFIDPYIKDSFSQLFKNL